MTLEPLLGSTALQFYIGQMSLEYIIETHYCLTMNGLSRYEKDIPEVKEIQEEERIKQLLGYSSEE